MEKLIEKLKDKTNISYDEAKSALENNNWDMLDAVVYLEEKEIIKKPNINIFYTNEPKEKLGGSGEIASAYKGKYEENSKRRNDFEGVFEGICKGIDNCNNIFLEIIRKQKVVLRIPLTVVILLLFFTFWFTIPLMGLGLLLDIEYFIWAKRVNTDKANATLGNISREVRKVKDRIKKEFKK